MPLLSVFSFDFPLEDPAGPTFVSTFVLAYSIKQSVIAVKLVSTPLPDLADAVKTCTPVLLENSAISSSDTALSGISSTSDFVRLAPVSPPPSFLSTKSYLLAMTII